MDSNRRKLNILIIPGIFPFPPVDGGKICVYSFIDILRHVQNIHLLLPVFDREQAETIEKMRKVWSNVNIHAVREYSFKLNSIFKNDTAEKLKKTYRRMLSLLPGIPSTAEIRAPHYEVAPYLYQRVSPPYSEKFIKRLRELLSEIKFDIVQTEHTPTLNLVNIIPREVKKIFVEIESRYLLVGDYRNTTGIDREYIDYIRENIQGVEMSYMRKYDAVFALSESDRERLQKNLPETKIYLSRYPVLDADISEAAAAAGAKKNIVFMGNEGHQSNRDGVYWFAREILPLVETVNYKNIYITGLWSPRTVREITALNSKIVFTGFVDDLKSVLSDTVSIVPIRLGGGGMRTKIIYAMASNSAVVTTSTGATGIVGRHLQDFLVADSGEDFAAALNRVLSEPVLFETLIANGRKNIRENYDQHKLAGDRNELYYEIINGRSR